MEYLIALTFLAVPAYVIKFKIFGLPTDLLTLWAFFVLMVFGIYLITKKQLPSFFATVKSIKKIKLNFYGFFFFSGILKPFIGGG